MTHVIYKNFYANFMNLMSRSIYFIVIYAIQNNENLIITINNHGKIWARCVNKFVIFV